MSQVLYQNDLNDLPKKNMSNPTIKMNVAVERKTKSPEMGQLLILPSMTQKNNWC